MSEIIYGLTHIPEIIVPIFNSLGNWGYLILFLITFMETGLVIFPWLPGESLIFVAASLAAISTNSISIYVLVPGFFLAAFIGDIVNYTIGTKLIKWPWLKRKVEGPKLDSAHEFFDKHGIWAIIFGRFVPLIRTFVPLISGTAGFRFSHFLLGNVIGTSLWVCLAAFIGYFFGTIQFVKEHYSLILLAIILVSLLPAVCIAVINYIKQRIMRRNHMLK
ncbi:VTT domain-containing protein [Limosilactobacillus secaliphilus]|uniref:DedA family protein n=1 Tax=Limosilactobacillus secaliphilus TaxID=396268 RepID=A0A0R2HZT4_9LACO|nr:VTT domain-containing protein [Limosilactobacillus secaliphilus]KRN58384.1 DedA family protein [Limosilactobacillus secaliphilus]